jgi:aspartyl-tRNA(Asn)/glutamyl-tRNA(Gln) amidotransferase subunit C
MVYPFEMETTFLREDVVENVLSEEDALKNAAKTRNGHVLVPKVVR